MNKKYAPVLLVLLALLMIVWSYRNLNMVYGDKRFMGDVFGHDSDISKGVVKNNKLGIAVSVIVMLVGIYLLYKNGKKLTAVTA